MLKKIWYDPVWSKVIAQAIFVGLVGLGGLGISVVQSWNLKTVFRIILLFIIFAVPFIYLIILIRYGFYPTIKSIEREIKSIE